MMICYLLQIHGIIFVIDSADTARLSTVKQVFNGMAADPRVVGKPVLLFANKQDLPGALSVEELAKALELSAMSTSAYHFTKCVYVLYIYLLCWLVGCWLWLSSRDDDVLRW